MHRKLLSVVLAMIMILSMTTIAFAAGEPTVTVSSAAAMPGDTVTLDVALSGNPGINTFSFGFQYDTARLSLTNVELAPGIPGQFTYSKKAVWLNSGDITTNGNYLKLTFKVLDKAAVGEAVVSATYSVGDIANYDEEDVNFQVVPGKITVTGKETEKGEITVGTASAVSGKNITVPVSITKNPGINTFSLGFQYDTTKLSLTSVEAASALGGQFTYSKKAVWLNSKDLTYTGEILYLNFKVADNCLEGDYAVTVTYNTGDISNYDEDDVYFDIIPGKVTVKSEEVFDTRVSVGNVTGRPGESVNVYISLDKQTEAKSMSVYDITYDSNKLTLKGAEWVVEDSVLSDWNSDDETGIITFKQNTALNDKLFLMTFEIKEGIEEGETEVGCAFKITKLDNSAEKELNVEVIPGRVNVLDILRGDVNGDDQVNSNDAIHLLYFTLLPERYEINQNGDFDGDGHVNSNDAIHLLYFTLLPDRYPLS